VGSSGNFLEHVFREAAKELFQIKVGDTLDFKIKQNEDMREVRAEHPRTGRSLVFTAAYGFRNIQNVIKRVTKVGGNPVRDVGHFVEILACPGGCLNGGGQMSLATSSDRQERKERLQMLEKTSKDAGSTTLVRPDEHPSVARLYAYMQDNGAKDLPKSSTPIGERSADADNADAAAVRRWLAAEWRSLKVGEDGKEIVTASVLKW
jgi:iron only hydrogenase large subunit-like protein